jgi:hypothetical protein
VLHQDVKELEWLPANMLDSNTNKEKAEKRVCLLCSKPLQKIGKWRRNGKKTRNDWQNRSYHVQCYKVLKKRG